MNGSVVEAALCLVVVGVSCVYAIGRGSPRFLSPYLNLACISACVYCAGQLASRIYFEPQAYAFALHILYAGLIGTVTFWWLAILSVAGHYRYIPSKPVMAAQRFSLGVMFILLLAVVSNPWHELVFIPRLHEMSIFRPLWYVNALILWGYIVSACGLAVYCVYKTDVAGDRRQMILLALAMLIPGILNALYLTGTAGVQNDPTAIGLAISSTVFIYAIFRGQLYLLSGVRIDQFMDNLKRPGMLVDRNYRLLYMNDAARNAFGDVPIYSPVVPVLTSRLISSLGETLTPERIESSSNEILQVADQPDSWSSIAAQPILVGQKRIGSLWILEDETARVQTSRQFEADQRLESLRMMAGGIAHDFNNLLQGVIGNAELVELSLPDDTEHARRLLENLITGGQKAAGLSQKLLAYSGRAQIKVEEVDLNELIEDVVGFMQIDVAPDIPKVVELAEQPLLVAVDPVQVNEIVFALLTNAYEAARENQGSVWLRSGQIEMDQAAIDACQISASATPGVYCYFSVVDSGPGLTPQMLARIFEPFYTTKALGRGLGLAAVSGIVVSHGGALRVTSPSQQQSHIGAEFVVFFRAVQAA